MKTVLLIASWLTMVVSQIAIKYGSISEVRQVPCFATGIIIGAVGMWPLMVLHRALNPNITVGLCIGGGFLWSEVALALIFHSRISLLQIIGILAISLGIFLLAGVKAIG